MSNDREINQRSGIAEDGDSSESHASAEGLRNSFPIVKSIQVEWRARRPTYFVCAIWNQGIRGVHHHRDIVRSWITDVLGHLHSEVVLSVRLLYADSEKGGRQETHSAKVEGDDNLFDFLEVGVTKIGRAKA